MADLVDGPASDEGEGENDAAQRIEQPGEEEGDHTDPDEQIGHEPEGEERRHQSRSTWISRRAPVPRPSFSPLLRPAPSGS